MIGGADSPPGLPSLLAGGVLKGDTSPISEEGSGAKEGRFVVSADCGFAGILGFAARLIGGGTGDVEETGRSFLRGFGVKAIGGPEGNKGFDSDLESGIGEKSWPANLDGSPLPEPGVCTGGKSSTACELVREGIGERTWGSKDLGGDWGDCIVTIGAEEVGDLGGEKAIIDVGLGFGLLHGVRIVVA